MSSLAPASLSGKRRNPAAVRVRTVLTLYSGRDDIGSHRVRILLAAKGITHELVVIDGAHPPADLLQLNPTGSTPSLVDRDLCLTEPDIIGEYLEERYPHPALLPLDPQGRARVRLSLRRIEREWIRLAEEIRQGGTKPQLDALRKRLKEGMVSAVPAFKASKFFLNAEMSVADCALAALVWRLPALGVNMGKEGAAILEYGERFFRNPAYNRSMTEYERALRPLA